ncbi:uncharacterized protein OCT59_008902 [Rhizophagus irregularis]|uniref:uncharacterized protein n=1 Tax=Rhizophagus irregularis TaxID=588596 RepID=UPI001C156300|nr:hypothetical protein OCT59_008902 [Rhizophagus irregularis]CAB4474888.1 unnamed protein product [Rhizophagus irregularis]CAB5198529.1 unnamed protein product [Rhizophagus irregularis]CAG8464507.1 7914_t:CDS:2 [Rhizophagus irregularis]
MEENLEDQEIKFTPEKSKFCPECNGPTTSFVHACDYFHLRHLKWLNILEVMDLMAFIQLFGWKVPD